MSFNAFNTVSTLCISTFIPPPPPTNLNAIYSPISRIFNITFTPPILPTIYTISDYRVNVSDINNNIIVDNATVSSSPYAMATQVVPNFYIC